MRAKTCSNKDKCCHSEGPVLTLSEFSGRDKSSDGLQYRCKECIKSYSKQWRKDNSEYSKTYYENNKRVIVTKSVQWNKNNSSSRKAISKNYRLNNLEKVNDAQRQWRINYPGKNAAKSGKYRAAKMQRTPKWLTPEDLNRMERRYEMSNLMSGFLGVQLHVDHIIPLQGKNVSGLHVPNNLQILFASDNLGKSNTFS